MSKARVYVVNATVPGSNYRPEPSVPFNKFYLAPQEHQENFYKLAPYGLIVPLTMEYVFVLQERGLDCAALMEQGYVVVVPTHMKASVEAPGYLVPTYLTNRHWRTLAPKVRRLKTFLPDSTGLITPSGVIEPICVSCENNLQHICGDCVLGSRECYSHLRIAVTQNADDEEMDASLRTAEGYKEPGI